ncbi:Topoisomerase 1-associated factor 1 [Actinomortierella wolfii]|nr:Topoisomerase 1-associated factor 1 [Actinomortierella wolfii]
MDKDTEDLLLSTCMALGGFEDQSIDDNDLTQVYVMGDEVMYCLKDIRKFIKYFEGSGDNPVLSFLGKINVLEKDLIPIILLNTPADSPTKERLITGCLELMVYMTEIVDVRRLRELAMQEEDLSIVGDLLEKQYILRQYKRAFLQPAVLSAILQVMLRPLATEYRQRTTNDMVIIRLGLFLFRNLVAIEDTEDSVKGTMDQFVNSILQEELLQRMKSENILELLVTLASSTNDVQLREWNVLAMETLYYIFYRINPAELIPPLETGGGVVRNTELADLLKKEERAKGLQNTSGMRRHSRFGTTAEVKLADGTRRILHNKGAFFKPLDAQLDAVKKPRMGGAGIRKPKPTDVYKKRTTTSGRALLRELAATLLESGFNRREIRGQSIKIREYHRFQYMYLMAFFLEFQRLYQGYYKAKLNALISSGSSSSDGAPSSSHQQPQAREQEIQRLQEMVKLYDFDLVASAIEVQNVYQVIAQIRLKYEAQLKKPEDWEEIGQALCCLQEQISTVDAMSKSPHEDYRDAADIVQYNLYYEESSLDLIVSMARSYHGQSKQYLGTLVKTVHLLLRMLETFSRSKNFVTVRKKRKEKEKKKKNNAKTRSEDQQGMEEAVRQMSIAGDDNESDDEDGDDHEPKITFQEHHLVFRQFERKFARESVVKTYCAYLEYYQELDEKALHYIATMFHRIAVNAQDLAVFYSLSTLHLFHRVLQSGLHSCSQTMVPCLTYIVHEFFKKWQSYPLLIVETLFPKSTRVSEDINIGREAREEKAKRQLEKQEKKMKNTELEPDPNVPWDQQIVQVVQFLVDDGKEELVDWTIKLLKDAIAQREVMNFRSEADLAENPDLMYSVSNIEDIPINPDSVDRKNAIQLNFKFRLLFKLLQFERCDEDDYIKYRIPTSLPTDTISHYLDMIQEAMSDDLDSNHAEQAKKYMQQLISQAKPKRKKGSAEDPAAVNAGTRVSKTSVAPVYHTSEYVFDSDDDDGDGDDTAFFAAEKRMRERFDQDAILASKAKYEQDRQELLAKERRKREERRLANARAMARNDQDDGEENEDEDEGDEEDSGNDKKDSEGDNNSDSDADRQATETRRRAQPKPRPRRLQKGGTTDAPRYNFFSDHKSDDGISDQVEDTNANAVDEERPQRSQRRLVLLEEDEDDEADEIERETQTTGRTSATTARKRRLLMDSDEEDESRHDVDAYDRDFDDDAYAEAQASLVAPPLKKQAISEVE